MYSLDINFLSDRVEVTEAVESTPIADTQYLFGGVGIAVLAMALAGGAYFYVQVTNASLQEELGKLTVKEQELDAKLKKLAQDESAIKSIQDRTKVLVDLFIGDLPPSAILQDIKARTLGNIKISSLSQSGKTIKILGQGLAFNDVNDLVLLLQSSPYFDPAKTTLGSAKLQPTVKDKQVALVDFDINAELTSKAVTELLPELQKSGSEGMVTRIKLLQQKGAIAQ